MRFPLGAAKTRRGVGVQVGPCRVTAPGTGWVLGLSIEDRNVILSVLDPPDAFSELRGVLRKENEWRRREGL